MRFWFSDEGSSKTQMCRLARAIAFRTNDTQNLSVGPHTTLVGGGGVPVLLFSCSPEIIWFVPLFPKSKFFSCSLFPNIVFFPPFSLKIWPLFPCTAEINALFHWIPNPLGWPHITVSIILFGTVTIKFFAVFFGVNI